VPILLHKFKHILDSVKDLESGADNQD